MFPHVTHPAHLLYSESENALTSHQSDAFNDTPPSCSAASQSVSQSWRQNGFTLTKKPLMAGWKREREREAWKGTKQTFSNHNKDGVKRTTAVRKSATKSCQSKQALRRRWEEKILLSLRHIQFFRGKNKRMKTVKKAVDAGLCGKHSATREQVNRMVGASLVKHILNFNIERRWNMHICVSPGMSLEPFLRNANWKQGFPLNKSKPQDCVAPDSDTKGILISCETSVSEIWTEEQQLCFRSLDSDWYFHFLNLFHRSLLEHLEKHLHLGLI